MELHNPGAMRKDVSAKYGACLGEGGGRLHPSQEKAAWKAEPAQGADSSGRQAFSGQYGKLSIPQEAFIRALWIGEEQVAFA